MWAALAPVGRDGRTGGYRRFAWTRTDATLREWFRGEATRRGLEVVPDRSGNLWAWSGDPAAAGGGAGGRGAGTPTPRRRPATPGSSSAVTWTPCPTAAPSTVPWA